MPRSRPNHVVVGGGIAGLVCALLLAEKRGLDVTVIERDPSLGGLLARLHYSEAGDFDFGMHNMYETGIPEFDELLFSLLPKNDWQILEGNRRDLAGAWFEERLQTNSPYPDLRHAPVDKITTYRREVLEAAMHTSSICDTAFEESLRLFGPAITREVISPCLVAQFRTDPHLLHRSALWLTNLHRVVLFDRSELLSHAEVPGIRERIAFPEQRELPIDWASGRRAFYPRDYGIYRVIDAIEARLRTVGVQILKSAQPVEIAVSRNRVESILVDLDGSASDRIGVAHLYWSAGLPAFAKLLKVDFRGEAFDHGRPTWVVNILIREPPQMDDLYYFFNYSSSFDTFRVTNYSAYSEGAPRDGRYPLAIELLGPPNSEPKTIVDKATNELVRFGVVSGSQGIAFAAAEKLKAGIPLLTSSNVRFFSRLFEALEASNRSNTTFLGVMPNRGIFFQRDVLEHVWETVMRNSDP